VPLVVTTLVSLGFNMADRFDLKIDELLANSNLVPDATGPSNTTVGFCNHLSEPVYLALTIKLSSTLIMT